MLRDYFENQVTFEKIILEWILNESIGREWTRLIWMRVGTSGTIFWKG